MERKELSSRIAGWALALQEFDFQLEHRPGYRMRHVDALSREPLVLPIVSDILHRVKAAQKEDLQLRPIFELLKIGKYLDYYTNDEVLFKIQNGIPLLVVPRKMEREIIKIYHDQGHFAVRKTEELIQRQFYIPKLTEKIKLCIQNCVRCIVTERKSGKQEGLLNPIPKGDSPLGTYHIDHLGVLSPTRKLYRYIFGVVDGFSKFTWIYPTKTLNINEVIQRLDTQKTNFDNPERIIVDKDGAFRSTVFSDYCAKKGINLLLGTAGVASGNGQVERIFRIIIPVLGKLSSNNSEEWYKKTEDLQRYLNNSVQRAIGMLPFELLFGVKMRTAEDVNLKQVVEEELMKAFVDEREYLREEAKQNIAAIQRENRRGYNCKRKGANEYKVGNYVLIKRTQFNSGAKLDAKYLGPYEVIKVKACDRYDVKKVSQSEGPVYTSTCAAHMKPYYVGLSSEEEDNDTNEDAEEVEGPSESDVIPG